MSDMMRRGFSDLEIRANSDGRTVHGISVPFDTPTEVNDFFGSYSETFARGAFARTIAERGDRVKFLYQHNSQQPIGRATELREDASGLYSEFRVSKTALGDEVLELVRDGALDSFSVGFYPVTDVTSNGGKDVTRTEVKLREVSAVTFPAYEGAAIGGVRALSGDSVKQAAEFAAAIRAGSPVSAANMATLKHVLSLVASADSAVDEAQPLLASILGVPNPDAGETSEPERSESDIDTFIRRARLRGIRL